MEEGKTLQRTNSNTSWMSWAGGFMPRNSDTLTEHRSPMGHHAAGFENSYNLENNAQDISKLSKIDMDTLSSQVAERTLIYQKAIEKQPIILIFEIFGNGENSYAHMTMRDVFFRIRKISESIELDNSIEAKSVEIIKKRRGRIDAISQVQYRDMRRLEYQFTPQEEPTVLVRRHCVLISLDPIRVIVMSERMILVVPDGADSILQLLCTHMESPVDRQNHTPLMSHAEELPFEIRAYEAIFGTVIEIQKQELKDLTLKIKELSEMFRKSSILPVAAQEDMRKLKYTVTVMIERAKEHKNILQELMDDDEAMALMNLTVLKRKSSLYSAPLAPEILALHEDMEALLESFLLDYTAIENQLRLLQKKMENAEDLVILRLDTSRNQLLITNTVVSVIACSFAGGGFVGSMWGMNLDSNLQNSPHMFWTVAISTLCTMMFVATSVLLYLTYTGVIPKRLENYTKIV